MLETIQIFDQHDNVRAILSNDIKKNGAIVGFFNHDDTFLDQNKGFVGKIVRNSHVVDPVDRLIGSFDRISGDIKDAGETIVAMIKSNGEIRDRLNELKAVIRNYNPNMLNRVAAYLLVFDQDLLKSQNGQSFDGYSAGDTAFSPEQEELLVSKARESLIMHLQVLIRAMAALKVPFTTKDAMTCAQSLLKVGVNRVWKDDLKDLIRTLWSDKGVQHTYNLRGSKYKLDDEEIANHLFASIDRIINVEYKPTFNDMKVFCPNLKELIPDPIIVQHVEVNNTNNFQNVQENNPTNNISDEDLDFTRAFYYETIIATMKVLIRAAASLRQPIGTKQAMEFAQRIFMIPDDNMEWNEDVANMIKVVWDDPGIKETYNKRGDAYTLEDPETIVYICDNLYRFLDYNYIPSKEDVEKAISWTTVPEEQVPDDYNNTNNVQNYNQTYNQTNPQTNVNNPPPQTQTEVYNPPPQTQTNVYNPPPTQTNVYNQPQTQTEVYNPPQTQTNAYNPPPQTQTHVDNHQQDTNTQVNTQINTPNYNTQTNNNTTQNTFTQNTDVNNNNQNNQQFDTNNPEIPNFSDEDKATVKPVIQDTLFQILKKVIIDAARTRTPFGSQDNLNLAKNMLSYPDENIKWTIEVQSMVESLYNDTGIQSVWKQGEYATSYFLVHLPRMVKVDYFPNNVDLIELDTFYNGEIPLPQDFIPDNAQIVNGNNQTTPPSNTTDPNINNTNPNINITVNGVNNNNTTMNDSNEGSPNVGRLPSSTVSVGSDSLILNTTIPNQNITKIIKIQLVEKVEDIISIVRKKPGVILDMSPHVCWWMRVGQEPLLLDSQQAVSFYPLKNKDSITILKPGEKPEDFKVDNFHTKVVNTELSPNINLKDKEKDKKSSLAKNFRKTISMSKDLITGKKKKKDKQ